jgi:hypothetical protein
VQLSLSTTVGEASPVENREVVFAQSTDILAGCPLKRGSVLRILANLVTSAVGSFPLLRQVKKSGWRAISRKSSLISGVLRFRKRTLRERSLTARDIFSQVRLQIVGTGLFSGS